jgi:hypothetical protein
MCFRKASRSSARATAARATPTPSRAASDLVAGQHEGLRDPRHGAGFRGTLTNHAEVSAGTGSDPVPGNNSHDLETEVGTILAPERQFRRCATLPESRERLPERMRGDGEAGEPGHAVDARTLGLVRVHTGRGFVTVDTFGSGFNTVLAVYTGTTSRLPR